MSQAAPDFSWVKEMKPAFVELHREADREVNLEILKDSGKPFLPIRFEGVNMASFVGEVGKKDSDLIFHFYPRPTLGFPPSFEDKMGDAFEKVFRHLDKVQAAYSDELNSWAVRVQGYGDNPSAEELSSKLFDTLNGLLS